MSNSQKRLIADWIKEAEKQGWTVVMGGPSAGHWKWYRPDGTLATVTPSTPDGGKRSIQNTLAKLRRAGLGIGRK